MVLQASILNLIHFNGEGDHFLGFYFLPASKGLVIATIETLKRLVQFL